MSNKHKISCVITLCDRQNFINEAIQSVLSQSLKPMEIIIVDNSTKKILIDEKYKDKIKIFYIIPRAGIAQALNFGASIAKGDYISFLEDDDLWPKNYLELVYKEFLPEFDFVATPINKLIDNKITKYKNPKNKINLNTFLLKNPGINISNLSVKKSSFFCVSGFETDLIHSVDKSLIIKFIINEYKGHICDQVSTTKRFHQDNFTFTANMTLRNLKIFYNKYKHLMSFKIKIKFYKKYLYYKYKR